MIQKKYFNGLLLSLFPLFIGGIIYICFRDENILLFSWTRYFDLNKSFLRAFDFKNNIILSFIVYSFPDGLWVLSGIFLLKIFLKNENRILIFYLILLISLSIFFEIGQLINIIPGTFDIIDLITIIIFSCIGLIIIIHRRKNEKN